MELSFTTLALWFVPLVFLWCQLMHFIDWLCEQDRDFARWVETIFVLPEPTGAVDTMLHIAMFFVWLMVAPYVATILYFAVYVPYTLTKSLITHMYR